MTTKLEAQALERLKRAALEFGEKYPHVRDDESEWWKCHELEIEAFKLSRAVRASQAKKRGGGFDKWLDEKCKDPYFAKLFDRESKKLKRGKR